MPKQWTADDILELARGFQPACILAAAADLDPFDALATTPQTAVQVAFRLRCDQRGITALLDAMVALNLLTKRADRYLVPPAVAKALTSDGANSVLAMAQHQANCLWRWSQLSKVVKTGRPAECTPSIHGVKGDAASFIGAMHAINVQDADVVVRDLRPLRFKRLLDVGGGSGTWTMAFLSQHPSATAIIFDLPHVVPMAEKRLTAAGLQKRVTLVAGDFYKSQLPPGADLAWVSAIVHQNCRQENQRLFSKIYQALDKGGRIAIRDIIMKKSRTAPVSGALFAINMLVATENGGTFTFTELQADLEAAGFVGAKIVRQDEGMNAVVVARKQL